jgi:diadenosine tetraphosphate (Ap4A) HIT family hydrolase
MSECKYCELVESKKNLLYEDENLVAIVPEKPITKGHIQVIAKKHHKNAQEIDDKKLEHLFYAASFSATALFENLGAQGTNLLTNTGSMLKEEGHFHIDVIARKSEDNLNFLWKPKKLAEEELKQVQAKIKDKCDMIGVEKKEKEVVDLDKRPEKLESAEEKPSEEKEEAEKEAGKEEKKEPEKEKETEAKKEPEEKKELPSEEEQRYQKQMREKKEKEEERKKKELKEEKESYLIKQLRRLP